jgi:hypothetical protein
METAITIVTHLILVICKLQSCDSAVIRLKNYKVEYFLPLILIQNYLQIRNKYTHCIAPYNLALNILSIKLCSILVNNKEALDNVTTILKGSSISFSTVFHLVNMFNYLAFYWTVKYE